MGDALQIARISLLDPVVSHRRQEDVVGEFVLELHCVVLVDRGEVAAKQVEQTTEGLLKKREYVLSFKIIHQNHSQ